jgi:pentatricopeptide repeat protein
VFEWWKKGRGPISAQFGASANKNGKMFVANSFLWSVDDVPKGVNRHDRVGVKWHPRRTAPSRMLFSLLDACAECGDVRRAIDMKSEILSWEGRLKHADDFERAWCSLLKAHSRSSEPLKALSAFEEMLKTNETETKNSLLAHNILMSACVKGGRPDWARDMLDKAKENGLKPDSISYATCAAGETQAARGILGSDYACDVETLKRLFREYTEIPRRNKIAYGAFVSAFLRRGETNYAIEVLEHARNDGPSSSRKKKTSKTGARDSSFAVSPNSYFLVMRHAANEGDVDGVRKLSEMLREHPKDTALLRSEAALYESEAFARAREPQSRSSFRLCAKTRKRTHRTRFCSFLEFPCTRETIASRFPRRRRNPILKSRERLAFLQPRTSRTILNLVSIHFPLPYLTCLGPNPVDHL